MSSFAIRMGAAAGWLALIGVVVGLVIIPATIAGQPPTTYTEISLVSAYFAHPQLAILLGLVSGFIAVAFIPFGLGLRAVASSGRERERAFADVGLAILVIAMGINLVSGALGAALVDVAARSGAELAPLFRLHEVLYNGLADVLEGAWIGAFSLAMLGGAMPRWIGWFGVAFGLAHWVKALEPFVRLPDAVDLLFGPLLVVWFLATVAALTRTALRSAPGPSLSAAPMA